jgi:hypothetical protein
LERDVLFHQQSGKLMLNRFRFTSMTPYGLLFLFVPLGLAPAAPTLPDAAQIVKKSVAANDADWRMQPKYIHEERDVELKVDSEGKVVSKKEKAYRVQMIDGSQYNTLIAINGEPLSSEQKSEEESKLKAEIAKRATQSSSERTARIQKYKKDRDEEHLLLQQMTQAFTFKLAGEEKIDGRDCYVLDATPDPGYQPPVTKARVLTGMKGRMWIEKVGYHWARVKAEVFRSVEFGLFLAKVSPGTEFQLDQAPVEGSIWMPSHFSQRVNAKVLGIYSIRSAHEEYYSNYQRQDNRPVAQVAGGASR